MVLKNHMNLFHKRDKVFWSTCAHFCAIEVQGRVHCTFIFLIFADAPPDVMKVAVDNPALLLAIQAKLDSMVMAEIPDNYHTPVRDSNQLSQPQFRPALMQSPIPNIDAAAFWIGSIAQQRQFSATSIAALAAKVSWDGMAVVCLCPTLLEQSNRSYPMILLKIKSTLHSKAIICTIPKALRETTNQPIFEHNFDMPLPETDPRTIVYELRRRSSDNTPLKESVSEVHHSNHEYDAGNDPDGPNSHVVAYSPALTSALGC